MHFQKSPQVLSGQCVSHIWVDATVVATNMSLLGSDNGEAREGQSQTLLL